MKIKKWMLDSQMKIIDAMRQAKDKDFIAKQYFSGFFEILKQPVLQENFRRQWINKEKPVNPCVDNLWLP